MTLDYRNEDYAEIKKGIDRLIATTPVAADYEAAKGTLLAQSEPYVQFLVNATRTSADAVRAVLAELSADREFFTLLEEGLQALAGHARAGVQTGEVRIHAHPIYAMIRLLRPTTVIETGIANGKSSSLILRALERNGTGRLHSVDLPTRQETASASDDGLLLAGRSPGWLVPDQLRTRWDVHLGDARELLPGLKKEVGPVDLFFHDSLHTFDHMMFELTLAKEWVRPGGTVMCDDIQNNDAFATLSRGLSPAVFGTFGVFHIPRGGL
jgi:hypothetical protein